MKWTQTILIPKSITKDVSWMNDQLVKIINGYDPGNYSQTYVNVNWDEKTDFDMEDAVQMISNTKRDFDKNLKYIAYGYNSGNENIYEYVRTAHHMDLDNNFLSNWLIGYSSYNPYIVSEFIPIWNGKILDEYIKNHGGTQYIWSVPLYVQI